MNKKELRRAISEKKRALTPEKMDTASRELARQFCALPAYAGAKTVYGYLSYNQEVRTGYVLEQALRDGKRVAVPKVYGEEMRFIYITDLSAVAPGSYGIPEPLADEPVADDPRALVLMPGLAFDGQGNRMGYGGGFYDRFLAREPAHPTVALCYGFQLVKQIPVQEHDVPVDTVLWAETEG